MVKPRVAALEAADLGMRAQAQARGVKGPDPNVLDPEAVPRDGVDLPSKFLAADHALVREHQGPIGPVGKCHVFVRCALAAAAATPTLTITQPTIFPLKACQNK